MATAAGILLAIDPWLGLVTLATWLSIAFVFRYSSLSALVAATVAPVSAVLMWGADMRLVGRRHHRLHPDRQTLAKPATPDGRHRTENRRQEEGRIGAFRVAAASVA